MMKARGTYYVPTLMAIEGVKEMLSDGYLPPAIAVKGKLAIDSLHATVRRGDCARGQGSRWGTDAAVYPHGRNAGAN